MNEHIKSAIEKGELVLFLGAGASKKCKTSGDTDLLDGRALAEELAKEANITYTGEDLDDVYAAVRGDMESRLDPFLERLFRHVRPSQEYQVLAQHAWRRVYTLNIDDGLERAFRNSNQNICVRLSADPIEERDHFFQRLDIVKLNGSIDRLSCGIIFSSSEYAQATNSRLPWYEQCGSDFVRLPFLFIGTKLKEPLLKFHIERYKQLNKRKPGMSFVITPSATDIEKKSLAQHNIIHISGTLSDFVDWLKEKFPESVTPDSLACASLPQYAAFRVSSNKEAYAKLFDGVCLVTRDMAANNAEEGAVRSFYKGFRPTWADIIGGIPAELDILDNGIRFIESNLLPNKIISFVGPAGSGKSTLLMQFAYSLSRIAQLNVYYLDEPPSDIRKTLEAIESASKVTGKVVVVIDNIDLVSDFLADVLESGKLSKTTVICAERENNWARRTKHKVGRFVLKTFLVREFSERDALNILHKLQQYGSWTVLGQMTQTERVAALINKAEKQLLIALMEATYGRGFEKIIESDYRALTTDHERLFFLTVGVITERNFGAPVSLVDRALSASGNLSGVSTLTDALAGIVVEKEGRLFARHRVYVRYLLEQVVDPELTALAINGLLLAFAQYQAPVIKHLNKVEAGIYKGLINHKFIWDTLKGQATLIIALYKSLEKSFELDGLFWLQYGLALRDLHDDEEALEKLRTAFDAYPMPHTQHALGQQLLILGRKISDKITAMAFAEEARALLEPLDEIMESDDTYPLVTLAEGHTMLVHSVEGDEQARTVAKSYLSGLERRCTAQPNNSRLQECHTRIFKFAATGVWAE